VAEVEQLAGAVAEFRRLLRGVADEEWDAPTPCTDWDVQALVQHVVRSNRQLAVALGGEAPEAAPSLTSPDEPQGLAAAFDASAQALVAAFEQPGALQRVVTVPFGTIPAAVTLDLRLTELLVHGWDLARATGQSPRFPAALAEQEIAFSVRALPQIPADRRPFAPSTEVAPGAPALDRLAGLLGRPV
jgi:uncharacterized protein (TIGR03086 family)